MNHFLNMVKKEVKELLTPATLVPIIVMAFLFATMGNMIGGAMEEAKEKPVIGIIDADESNVSYEMGKVVYNGSDKNNIEEGLQILKEFCSYQKILVLLFPKACLASFTYTGL
ncbi:hypothetical protein B6U81_07120 [Thermoplasmatales archaeon ex4484_30]|nr:MAG: hypothetical protein B6U81_07120 [Thermoplasmatales archaeon ex4484_30]